MSKDKAKAIFDAVYDGLNGEEEKDQVCRRIQVHVDTLYKAKEKETNRLSQGQRENESTSAVNGDGEHTTTIIETKKVVKNETAECSSELK